MEGPHAFRIFHQQQLSLANTPKNKPSMSSNKNCIIKCRRGNPKLFSILTNNPDIPPSQLNVLNTQCIERCIATSNRDNETVSVDEVESGGDGTVATSIE